MVRKNWWTSIIFIFVLQISGTRPAWATDCGPNWDSMGDFSCDANNNQHQQICGCEPPSYNDSAYWDDLGGGCYTHFTGNTCDTATTQSTNPPTTTNSAALADCGANWSSLGDFSCDVNNNQHQKICGCLPPFYNDPVYWVDLGAGCYTHFTGGTCSGSVTTNTNTTTSTNNTVVTRGSHNSPTPPAVSASNNVFIAPQTTQPHNRAPAVSPASLSDCGSSWSSQGTFSCDATGFQHQEICSCRPPLADDPAVWITYTSNGRSCYSHFTGDTTACTHPPTGSQNCVNTLCTNILGRSCTSDETLYWANQIDSGLQTCADVHVRFVASDQNNVQDFVVNTYSTHTHRTPSPATVRFYSDMITSGQRTRLQMEQQLLQSDDYRNTANSQPTDCTLIVTQCPAHSGMPATFTDTTGGANVNQGQCQQRANDVYQACGGAEPVVSVFRNGATSFDFSAPGIPLTTGNSAGGMTRNTNLNLAVGSGFNIGTGGPVTTRNGTGNSTGNNLNNTIRYITPEEWDTVLAGLNDGGLMQTGAISLSPDAANFLLPGGLSTASGVSAETINQLLQYANLTTGAEARQWALNNGFSTSQADEIAAGFNTGARAPAFDNTFRPTPDFLAANDPISSLIRANIAYDVSMGATLEEAMAANAGGLPLSVIQQIVEARPLPGGTISTSPDAIRITNAGALLGALNVFAIIGPYLPDLTIASLQAFQNTFLYNALPQSMRDAIDSYLQRVKINNPPPVDPNDVNALNNPPGEPVNTIDPVTGQPVATCPG